eukprot:7369701-Alexandrium_andersonii.AAC.1
MAMELHPRHQARTRLGLRASSTRATRLRTSAVPQATYLPRGPRKNSTHGPAAWLNNSQLHRFIHVACRSRMGF